MAIEAPNVLPAQDPGIASVEEGIVVLDGPNGVAVTMTADCALRTGLSLIAAAEEANRAHDI
jgi:hypothetical protein